MSNEQSPLEPLEAAAFDSFGGRIKGEREERLVMSKRRLSFGVKFLDRALGGIAVKDIVLLGAKTGIGKTTLASIIAESNAEQGKRVHYFALEAEHREIERRIKFRVLSRLAYQRSVAKFKQGRINYLDWYNGELDDILGAWEGAADELLAEKYKTLHTCYRFKTFKASDLERSILSIQDETDLIIVDHLHMVDHDDDSENRGIKQVIMALRDSALEIGKPVVLVAHLRKTDRRSKFLMPDLDDFHGTSEISKLVTKAVLLAPAYDQETKASYSWNTYVHPAKCRQDGTRTRYVGLVPFNAQTGRYDDQFDIGQMIKNGEEFSFMTPGDPKYPLWAID